MTDVSTNGQVGHQSERSKRSLATRSVLLSAAARVFASVGYADASVNDIVDHAGMSVGSLYHHFGSKAALYVELFNEYHLRQQHRSARAFRAALSAGEEDTMALFLAGMRAYLEGAWQDRHVARIFVSGGGPPGFDHLLRRRFHDWLHHNADGLEGQARHLDQTLLLILTTVATEAGREVAVQPSRARARVVIDQVLRYASQLHPLDPDALVG
jgi:AcrR family transcriptional regulator